MSKRQLIIKRVKHLFGKHEMKVIQNDSIAYGEQCTMCDLTVFDLEPLA